MTVTVDNAGPPTETKLGIRKPVSARIPTQHGFGIMPRLLFGLGTIAVLVLGIGGWAIQAEISGAVIAQGSVVVERHVKKIQHRDGGIVAKINVRNGDRIKAGDILVTLDDTQLKASLAVIQSQLIELTGRHARLKAERDGLPGIEYPPEFHKMGAQADRVMVGERRLFKATKETRKSQVEQLTLRISQINSEIVGLTAQQKAKAKELILMSKELKQVRRLQKRKLTPVSRVYAMEREATRLEGEKGEMTSQIARAGGRISEVRVQILNIEQSARSEAQKEIRELEANLNQLREREVAAKDQLNRVDLRAPLAGIVHELAVHTIGGVISPAEEVMLIVPKSDDLTVLARISPSDIDQVIPGQTVRLRFSAFNQRKTPELPGRVIKVSADVSNDHASGQRYYNANLEIIDSATEKLGGQEILPGMPVEVFITTKERTALSYLVKPFVDQLARTFLEE